MSGQKTKCFKFFLPFIVLLFLEIKKDLFVIIIIIIHMELIVNIFYLCEAIILMARKLNGIDFSCEIGEFSLFHMYCSIQLNVLELISTHLILIPVFSNECYDRK